MKLHTVYKVTLSGVLFALIVEKIPLSNFFYTSTATDASDKYEVCTLTIQKLRIRDIFLGADNTFQSEKDPTEQRKVSGGLAHRGTH